MATNNQPLAWPLTPDARMQLERAARQERAKAVAAFGHAAAALVKRVFGLGAPITIWVPSVKGGHRAA